jgi:dTDP-4-dehydrorhamnose reductase
MKLFVTGAQGQLGAALCAQAAAAGIACAGTDRDSLDITDAAALLAMLDSEKPTHVLHCAAYTAVDDAESHPDLAHAVNTAATAQIARWCGTRGVWLIYVSTDYVFDGSGETPWEVTDTPSPLSVYGKTKLGGEEAVRRYAQKHMIVRTSWVFGENGQNFVKTMLRLGATRDVLRVVNDQVGAPTYAADLARLLLEMVSAPQAGTYHAAGRGNCTWADFAAEILRRARLNARVEGIPSAAYPQPAPRPKNSRLSPQSLLAAGYAPLPPWQDALSRFLISLGAAT